jgi:hypothetical protein
MSRGSVLPSPQVKSLELLPMLLLIGNFATELYTRIKYPDIHPFMESIFAVMY